MAAGDVTKALMANVRVRVGQASQLGILNATLLAYLNRAQDELLIRLDDAPIGCMSATATGSLTEGTEPCHTGAMYVNLPTGFVREGTVFYEAEQAMWHPVSYMVQLDRAGHGAPTTSDPYYYIWDGRLWLEAGTVAAATYTMYYIARPTQMSLTVDPTISDEFYGMLENFAVARCREQLGDGDEERRILEHHRQSCTVLNSRWGAPVYEGPPGDSEGRA